MGMTVQKSLAQYRVCVCVCVCLDIYLSIFMMYNTRLSKQKISYTAVILICTYPVFFPTGNDYGYMF
jgi:hypothetical protein